MCADRHCVDLSLRNSIESEFCLMISSDVNVGPCEYEGMTELDAALSFKTRFFQYHVGPDASVFPGLLRGKCSVNLFLSVLHAAVLVI